MVLSIVYRTILAVLRYRISAMLSIDKYSTRARECIYGPHCAGHRSCRLTEAAPGNLFEDRDTCLVLVVVLLVEWFTYLMCLHNLV